MRYFFLHFSQSLDEIKRRILLTWSLAKKQKAKSKLLSFFIVRTKCLEKVSLLKNQEFFLAANPDRVCKTKGQCKA